MASLCQMCLSLRLCCLDLLNSGIRVAGQVGGRWVHGVLSVGLALLVLYVTVGEWLWVTRSTVLWRWRLLTVIRMGRWLERSRSRCALLTVWRLR